MPPRRSHAKSRNGCLRCKRRKVKCDETPIACGSCVKGRVTCSFTEAQAPRTLPRPAPQAGSAASSSLLDLELLHNFMAETAAASTGSQHLQQFYREDLVRYSFTYEYILYTVLALSAFHLAHQRRQVQGSEPGSSRVIERYRIAAFLHHNQALYSFRQALADVNERNCHYIFACGGLLSLTSFARAQVCPHHLSQGPSAPSPLSPILECIDLMRGMHNFLDADDAYRWIRSGPMSIIFQAGVEGADAPLDEEASAEIRSLMDMFQEKSSGANVQVYQTAAEHLRSTFIQGPEEEELAYAFRWAAIVLPEYMVLLKANEPEALLILAYWCVLLNKTTWCWAVKGWPREILETAIIPALDDTWMPWLRWPVEKVMTGRADQENCGGPPAVV